jgi:Transglutaminase-like superfamily
LRSPWPLSAGHLCARRQRLPTISGTVSPGSGDSVGRPSRRASISGPAQNPVSDQGTLAESLRWPETRQAAAGATCHHKWMLAWRAVVKLVRLTPGDRRRAAEATLELVRASLELHRIAPAVTMQRLGALSDDPEENPDDAQLHEAERIGRIVAAVAHRLPWQPSCLRQALAVQRMLRRRRIGCRLHLGVMSSSVPAAHAWVTVGGHAVVGGAGLECFVPLAKFE